jgi:hypothetical protein
LYNEEQVRRSLAKRLVTLGVPETQPC